MTYNPDIHHRRSIRLHEYDYSAAGAYFVTLCAFQRECLFGEIVDGEIVLNEMGRTVAAEWEKTPTMRPNVSLDVFAIMPNHIHGILFVRDDIVGAHCMHPDDVHMGADRAHVGAVETRAHISAPLRRQSGSIGSILAGFKSATTKRINQYRNNPGCPVWQRNYYERVIRNDRELARAREYIVDNPMKWALDKENPANNP